jgi:hypothetical protein
VILAAVVAPELFLGRFIELGIDGRASPKLGFHRGRIAS